MQTIGLALSFLIISAAYACMEGSYSAPVVTPFAIQDSSSDRFTETVKQASAKSKGGRFWVVYAIESHHAIGVDEAVPEVKNVVFKEGLRLSLRPASASRNISVFLLYHGNQIERIEIHDRDRYRAQDQYPVHSVGPVTNADSIALLKNLFAEYSGKLTGERLVLAIGLHDDPQVAPALLSIINNPAASEKERGTAAMWLGQIAGQKSTLENLARDEEQPIEIRKQAIIGLGFSRYPDVLPTLENFYETFSERELKQQALFAASHTINPTEASAFLSKVKNTDPDQDLRQQASLWLQRLSTPTNP